MRNLIGLITLFGLTMGNVYSQTRVEHAEIDTVINGGHLQFFMHSTSTNVKNQSFPFNITIFNSAEEERKRREEEHRRIIEYIDSMKVILFTNVIGLTSSEASVFWTTYNDYQSKLDEIQNKRGEMNDKLCDPFGKYTNIEYSNFAHIKVKSYKDEAFVMEKYEAKFRELLGKKYYLLYRAEHLFMIQLLREGLF
ncbi:MAG: hypothetical protein LBT24_04790 [Tannerella sp.]|jgi:hypothetical protein|nr:hypothetical protein [Tannerella sp.]